MADKADHPIDLATQTNFADLATSGKPTTENKGMATLATTSDGDLACNTGLAKSPVFSGYVVVLVRGLMMSVGDGTKDKCGYFSRDSGATALAFADLAAGDKFYWNGSVAGYQLGAGWRIDFYYLESTTGIGGVGGGAAGIATTGRVDLYVRDADGDDTNGGTLASPLKTVPAAIAKFPYIAGHLIVVHVGPGTYSEDIVVPEHLLRENIYFWNDGGGGGTDGFSDVISSTAALAGSDRGVIKTSGLSDTEFQGLGELHGRTVEILTGAAAGDRRHVRNNTADSIYPTAKFSAEIAEGDTYRVIEATAILEGKITVRGCGRAVYDGGGKGVRFVGFKNGHTTNGAPWACRNSGIALWGHELIWPMFANDLDGSDIVCGVEDFFGTHQQITDDLGLANNTMWYGWGLSCTNQASNRNFVIMNSYGKQARFFGSFATGGVNLFNKVYCTMYYGALWNYGALMYDSWDSILVVSAVLTANPINQGIILGGSATSYGFRVEGGTGYISAFGEDALVVNAKTGIRCGTRGNVTVWGEDPNLKFLGERVAFTFDRGDIRFRGDPPLISVSDYEVSEDNGATKRLLADVIAAGMFEDQYHGRIWHKP